MKTGWRLVAGGKGENERGAHILAGAGGPNAPTVQRHDDLSDGQPQAKSTGARQVDFFNLVEAIEDVGQLVNVNAGPQIYDGNRNNTLAVLFHVPGLQTNLSANRAEPAGVFDQVSEHFVEIVLVAADASNFRLDVDAELLLALRQQWCPGKSKAINPGCHPNFNRTQRQTFELLESDELVDKPLILCRF